MEDYLGAEFKNLLGLTLTSISGAEEGSSKIVFQTDNRKFYMAHYQDCCEHVRLIDICGDISDLIGNPILDAREESNVANPEEVGEYGTWTFYHLATIKGSVVFRWLGESNGYYSEEVDFDEIIEK